MPPHKKGPRPSRTADLKKRAEVIIARLEKDSVFFASGNEAKIPTFHNNEVVRGGQLGEGEFSIVSEITQFKVQEECNCIFHGGLVQPEGDLGAGTPKDVMDDERLALEFGYFGLEDDAEHDESEGGNYLGDGNEDRGFMKEHCFREGSARYAIKQLKGNRTPEEQAEAIIDIAMEAKFLALLSHSNIIKMRGTVGTPCHTNFCIVLDRLYDTLEQRIDLWADEEKQAKGLFGIIGEKKVEMRNLFSDRLLAALDIARAMKYLHGRNVMYRDLKPENIGFDVRGDAKIFDFGLAKECLTRDFVGTDQYKASGLTGSRRYMSPEVALCKPYGLSTDVFSFSILLWEMMSLKIPFAGYDVEKHAEKVVHGGKRPKILKHWPVFLKALLESGWSVKPPERPTFTRICDLIRGELVVIEGSMTGELADRSKHLLDQSYSSRNGTD